MNSIQHLIEIALKEDIGPGDITTDNLIDPNLEGRGIIIAKEPLVVAGLEIVTRVFQHLDPNVILRSEYADGDTVEPGDTIADVEGRLRALLSGERTALNFLQRLSGVATFVRSHVNELAGKNSRLVDTRKTTPGWRVLEKYAVRVGGAHNHRMGLYDGVLIKDNHIAACGGIKKAVDRIRTELSHLSKIEVEVANMKQVEEALEAGADVIMLDNMNVQQIKDAIAHIDGKAVVEVSGNVKKNVLKSLADTGADIISAGALTHSARCVDISMRVKAADELL
ncbi:MAG: carboxylating nicotinate-nucleotide diphosphorylase [Deltaproteobacteria bacterium]|jgi:nicotinate-nucleotide pyrophosphorylase (carboxylating)|nr:carboxylating nicotinate-nucleotide diphosphorylase [Deltaproteobacteria bacterium]MBW2669403.1 carboxylating nicotinate-nucleotide diphosphorylase [Deltaproteobacteria bacterium]